MKFLIQLLHIVTRHPVSPPWNEQAHMVAFVGMLSLAVAMGVGRFAFTPLLPMMLHDGTITLSLGSWLATANYAGYLAGALACMALPWLLPQFYVRWHPARLARAGLVATVLLTLAMALPAPSTASAWPTLRFAAGVASAFVLLNTSAWCMVRLAALGRPAFGGLIFCGPGLGIVLTGLMAAGMASRGWQAAAGWAVFALLSLLLCLLIWPVLHGRAAPSVSLPADKHSPARPASLATPQYAARILHAIAYGLAGFGYIVTATFLPVIARAALPADSPWPDGFWPVFGMGVILGAIASTRVRATWDKRWLLAACYTMQAFGIVLGLLWPTPLGFALGSLLLGIPFTAITFFALQEARRLWPVWADSFASLVTAVYGAGQIVGPPLVAALLAYGGTEQGFTLGLLCAVTALVIGALMYLLSVCCWPKSVAIPVLVRHQ